MAEIDDQLALYTQASKGRTIEFQYAFDEDNLGRDILYLQAKMTGKDFIVSKTIVITPNGYLGEPLEYMAKGLRAMLETADDHAQIGGFGSLLPIDEPEE